MVFGFCYFASPKQNKVIILFFHENTVPLLKKVKVYFPPYILNMFMLKWFFTKLFISQLQ